MSIRGIRSVAFLLVLLNVPAAVRAQTVRVTGTTTFQYLDLRQSVVDSVLTTEATGQGILRSAPDGSIVQCVTGDPVCRYMRAGPTAFTAPVLQDLTMTAWGLGRGVRVYARLRSRAVLAGADSIWPQETDHLDVMAAYAELDRTRVRVRAGRQYMVSGLGYYNYDGGSALFRFGRGLTVEGYGGRSLARGLNESLTSSAIAAVESFHPDKPAWILGGRLAYRGGAGSVSALYQREIRTDRAGLYSERATLDGVYRTPWGQIEGTMEADLASRVVNDATLRARYDLTRQVSLTAFARQYRPFFELWTIWGAFDPVGFRQAGLSGSWRALGKLAQLQAGFSYLRYPNTHTDDVFGSYRNDGWRASATGTLGLAPTWTLQGSYMADIGFGAAKTQSLVRLQHRLGSGMYIGANATAFQTSYELRIPKGTVWGLGGDAQLKLGSRSRASASATWYRHTDRGNAPEPDWSQVRATLSVAWTLGPEPGLTSIVGGIR
jgi:hypothetical protein